MSSSRRVIVEGTGQLWGAAFYKVGGGRGSSLRAVGLLGDRSFKLVGEDAVNYHISAEFCRLARL